MPLENYLVTELVDIRLAAIVESHPRTAPAVRIQTRKSAILSSRSGIWLHKPFQRDLLETGTIHLPSGGAPGESRRIKE